MADVIAFNDAHADKALRFGQDLFLAAEATCGDLSEPDRRSPPSNALLQLASWTSPADRSSQLATRVTP
jgi:hypothetical protein